MSKFNPLFDPLSRNNCYFESKMATVSIIFRKNKLNKKGLVPIRFRIVKKRISREISTGLLVAIQDWDDIKKTVKRSHPNSVRFNAILADKFAEIQNEVINLEQQDKNIASRQTRDKVYGKKSVSYFEVAEDLLETYREKNKYGT
jgi:hypothetical protein